MRIHIAQKGETLWTIAKKYGVNFEELKNMNAQLSNPNMIMPGMKIKVPGTGGAVQKEHHHHNVPQKHHHVPQKHHHVPPKEVKKEVPKEVKPIQYKEVPIPTPPKEIIKEVPKEVPYPIYQPVMPQMPEIDINNYYTMHMNQMQAQLQQAPPPPPKEMPVVEEESPMPVMPVQHAPYVPPMQYCYYQMPVMPVCDPCYPYPHGFMNAYPQQMMMMPQVQGVATQPAMYQPAPVMYQPTILPGTVAPGYEMESSSWGESSSHTGMQHYLPQGMYNQVSPAAMPNTGFPMAQMPATQGDCGCGGTGTGAMPYPGQYGQYPGYMQPMPYGTLPYGAMPNVGFPPHRYGSEMAADPYAMPMRNNGEEDESAD